MGERLTVDVGPIAHGGHCVARAEGRVVFVRHALPGERVEVVVTEGSEGDRFWRADAVTVLEPSPDRVTPPCPYAGPDACGGCDFQHVDLGAQRRLKTAVVREQLVRLGRLDPEDPLVTGLEVEAVPVDGRPDDGLRWRTRQRYAVLPDGRPAMRAHRSHHLVHVDDCLIAVDDARPRGDAVPGPHGEWSPGQPEADTEDLMGGSLYVELVNKAYNLKTANRLSAPAAGAAGRIVPVVADRFRTLPPDVAEFDHYAPSLYLFENRTSFFKSVPAEHESLERFEKLITDLNSLLPPKK